MRGQYLVEGTQNSLAKSDHGRKAWWEGGKASGRPADGSQGPLPQLSGALASELLIVY